MGSNDALLASHVVDVCMPVTNAKAVPEALRA